MNITVDELLARVDESLRSCSRCPELAQATILPLSLDDDQESFNTSLALLDGFDDEAISTILYEPDMFVPMANAILQILGVFHQIIDHKRFSPAVIAGANIFCCYTQVNPQEVELAYRLGEALRAAPSSLKPYWLNDVIIKFYRRHLNELSVDTLVEIARNSINFNQNVPEEAQATDTFAFTNQLVLRQEGVCNNPFLSTLMRYSMPLPKSVAKDEPFDGYSNIKKGLDRLSDQLIRLEGRALNIPCLHIDYLLVGQLIDFYSRAYDVCEEPGRKDQYVRSVTVLTDLVLIPKGVKINNAVMPYRKRVNGAGWLNGSLPGDFLERFGSTMAKWPVKSPFSASMNHFRRAVLSTTLNACERMSAKQFSSVANDALLKIMARSKSDLLDQEFHAVIAKSGRRSIALLIGKLNDPVLTQSFLKQCPDVKHLALDSELGL